MSKAVRCDATISFVEHVDYVYVGDATLTDMFCVECGNQAVWRVEVTEDDNRDSKGYMNLCLACDTPINYYVSCLWRNDDVPARVLEMLHKNVDDIPYDMTKLAQKKRALREKADSLWHSGLSLGSSLIALIVASFSIIHVEGHPQGCIVQCKICDTKIVWNSKITAGLRDSDIRGLQHNTDGCPVCNAIYQIECWWNKKDSPWE